MLKFKYGGHGAVIPLYLKRVNISLGALRLAELDYSESTVTLGVVNNVFTYGLSIYSLTSPHSTVLSEYFGYVSLQALREMLILQA